MAGDRGDDLADGTGRDHSAAAGVAQAPVRPAGSFPRSGKETETAIHGHGQGPQHHAAGCAGLVRRSSMHARSAHLNEEQKGAKPPDSNEADFCHGADHLTRHDEVV